MASIEERGAWGARFAFAEETALETLTVVSAADPRSQVARETCVRARRRPAQPSVLSAGLASCSATEAGRFSDTRTP